MVIYCKATLVLSGFVSLGAQCGLRDCAAMPFKMDLDRPDFTLRLNEPNLYFTSAAGCLTACHKSDRYQNQGAN